MKPIKLTIAGLNSFKEEQTIDFEQLSELGMFGIFGNTGSGKSTILDAMTLALFGKVVRAGKSNIINQAETKMRVEFTFSLGAGSQRRLYRTERAYRTRDHVSVTNVRSRLLDVSDGDKQAIVVAEQEQEVTRYIEKLLGMKADDFTRAVVLPQGSFADFLKMQPGKRREMLERLFSLEKYGNLLTDKVNKRLDEANALFNRLDGEQRGLGQASADHVKAALQEKNAACEREQQAAQMLTQIQTAYEQASRIYNLQAELTAKQTELSEHRKYAASIAALRQESQRAADAAAVKPLLEESQLLDCEVQGTQKRHQELTQAAQRLQQLNETCLAALNNAKSARIERQPVLIERQTKLQDAQVLESETAVLADKVKQLAGEVQQAQQQQTTTAAAIKEIVDSLENISQEINKLEIAAAAAKVQHQFRALLQQAVSQADNLDQDVKNLALRSSQQQERQRTYESIVTAKNAAEQRAAAIAASLAVLADAEAQARQNCPADESALAQQEIALAELKNKTRDLQDKTARLEREQREAADLNKRLADARLKQNVAKTVYETAQTEVQSLTDELTASLLNDRQAMAAVLAAGLQPGQPCPVCGSHEHPCLAAAAAKQASATEKADLEAAIIAAKAKAQRAETEWRQTESVAINLNARLEAAQARVDEFSAQLAAELSALAATWRLTGEQVSLQYLNSLIQSESSNIAAAKKRLAAWRSERETADKKLKELELQRSETTSEIAGLQAAMTAAAAELARTQAEAAGLKEKIAAAADALNSKLSELGCQPQADITANLQTVAALKADVLARDRKVEELQSVIGKKRVIQQQEQQRLEHLRQNEQQLSIRLAQLRADEAANTRQLSEKQAQLRSLTQGAPVGVLLEQVKSELAALARAEQTAQEQYDDNQAALHNAKLKLTACQTELANLTAKRGQIQESLTQKLNELAFASIAEAQAAYRDPAALEAMQREITGYVEKENLLNSECEQLLAKLAGQSISPAEWEDLNTRFAAAKAAKEQASERRIVAEQIYNDVLTRHERWQVLENQLITVRQEQQNLITLKNLIRGNKLVEFMAQEQMDVVVRHASDRLKQLTANRYGLELDSEGSFIIRDDDNAGAKRPVNTLSGGETFQTSLALALALSTQIQLKGEHPLEFFFLDEGFGTLDQSLLETVMSSLERLPLERMTIGLISHVEALKQRMLRRLIVEGAEPNGKGTRVRIELA